MKALEESTKYRRNLPEPKETRPRQLEGMSPRGMPNSLHPDQTGLQADGSGTPRRDSPGLRLPDNIRPLARMRLSKSESRLNDDVTDDASLNSPRLDRSPVDSSRAHRNQHKQKVSLPPVPLGDSSLVNSSSMTNISVPSYGRQYSDSDSLKSGQNGRYDANRSPRLTGRTGTPRGGTKERLNLDDASVTLLTPRKTPRQ